MLTRYECNQLITQIMQGSDAERQNALERIFEADEAAITPLIDHFYAGVNESTGLVIIALLNYIGGYEAQQLFHDLLDFPQPHNSWEWAAEAALQANSP